MALLTVAHVLMSAAATALPTACTDVIIGAGWSGVYFAYRRAMSSRTGNANICLFEASDRVGGRTYSVPPTTLGHAEFTLDVGAYRFSPDMHLPGDLILHDLLLPTACYEPGCPSAATDFPKPFIFNYTAPLRRIVDATTRLPAGYASAMHAMLARVKKQVTLYLNASLVGLTPLGPSTTQLAFSGGHTVRATGVVLLNLPRNRLLMLRESLKPPHVAPRTLAMLECIKFDAPAKLFHNMSMESATALAKAYLYYEDAWWWTRINQTVGQTPANAFLPLSTSTGIFVGVHWNDGPVRCTSGVAGAASYRPEPDTPLPAGTRCSGYLEMYYAATNETFFYGISGAPTEPLGIAHQAPPFEHAKVEEAHAALLEAIAPLLRHKGVAADSLAHPSQLVVGVWSRPSSVAHDTGYTAPTKVYWAPEVSGSPGKACGVDGLTDAEYRTTVLQPFGRASPIFLANNDWICQDVTYFYGDWAEETLLQAERALHRLGVPRPAWLNASYYHEKVASKA